MNLLKETLEVLKRHGKSTDDVVWIGDGNCFPINWNTFKTLADFDYDDGYGCVEINQQLVIVGEDWWLERYEYDGSENWVYKTLPMRPTHPDKKLELKCE